MTPFERAAKALGEVYDGCADPVSSPNNWARAQEGVRAVLQAIREPSEAMFEAYTAAADDIDGPAAMHLQERAYQAMIDAALSE